MSHPRRERTRNCWPVRTSARKPSHLTSNAHRPRVGIGPLRASMGTRRRAELKARSVESLEWALSYHLLPFFSGHRLTEITAREVDRYRTAKVAEGALSGNSI